MIFYSSKLKKTFKKHLIFLGILQKIITSYLTIKKVAYFV